MKSAAICIAKNEGAAIFEWCLYQAFMGFDAVIIFNNNSTDNTVAEIAKASRHADVRCIDWPMHPGQIQAYNFAIEEFKDEFDVFAMIDADEFIVPEMHDSIRELLDSCPAHPHVAIQWVMYGSSGHITRPKGLVTESYTWTTGKPNGHIKTICRPALFSVPSVFESPHYMGGSSYVFLDGTPVEWGTKYGKVAVFDSSGLARINHYWTKSKEDFEAKKARGRATRAAVRADQFEDVDINRQEDRVLVDRFSSVLTKIKSLI